MAKAASDKLLAEHNIYVQSINYPTVARGEERLRITVTPRHTVEQINGLISAVDQIFTELGIKRLQDWKRLGGRAAVGLPGRVDAVQPIWNDKQLGLMDGTTPKTLRNADKAYVDVVAVEKARSIFNNLLGRIAGPVQAARDVYPVVADGLTVPPGQKLKLGNGVHLETDFAVTNRTVSVSA